MRFSKENQPKHHTTDERKVQFTIRLKPSTKDFYKGRRGLASKVLEEYKKQGEMKTIEERAKSHAGVSTNPRAIYNEDYVLATRYASYKEGATEQKAIDEKSQIEEMKNLNEEWKENLRIQKEMLIEKACEWQKAYCGMNESGLVQFRKAMEQ